MTKLAALLVGLPASVEPNTDRARQLPIAPDSSSPADHCGGRDSYNGITLVCQSLAYRSTLDRGRYCECRAHRRRGYYPWLLGGKRLAGRVLG